MIRNLKTLGLVLVAIFAMSAVAASAASAQKVGKLTSDGQVTLIGKHPTIEPTKNNKLTLFTSGEVTCANAIYTGHKYNVTPHELIPSGASTVTITPHYGVCSAFGFPMTIDMNGCDYVFHLGETSGADKYPVSATVVCPIGQHVTFTIFGSATKHTANEPFCHITVTEKTTDYTGLSASDTTNGQVDISGTIEGIKIDKKRANGSILCPAVDEVDENAKLDMEITLEGKNGTGGATPISITHEP